MLIDFLTKLITTIALIAGAVVAIVIALFIIHIICTLIKETVIKLIKKLRL